MKKKTRKTLRKLLYAIEHQTEVMISAFLRNDRLQRRLKRHELRRLAIIIVLFLVVLWWVVT